MRRPVHWAADSAPIAVDEATFRARRPLPECIHCGGLARPNVLMFDDYEWLSHRTQQQLARYQTWLASINRQKLAIVELGAGLAVPSVRHECQRQGGTLIRINVREPQLSSPGISIDLPALKAIAEIAAFF